MSAQGFSRYGMGIFGRRADSSAQMLTDALRNSAEPSERLQALLEVLAKITDARQLVIEERGGGVSRKLATARESEGDGLPENEIILLPPRTEEPQLAAVVFRYSGSISREQQAVDLTLALCASSADYSRRKRSDLEAYNSILSATAKLLIVDSDSDRYRASLSQLLEQTRLGLGLDYIDLWWLDEGHTLNSRGDDESTRTLHMICGKGRALADPNSCPIVIGRPLSLIATAVEFNTSTLFTNILSDSRFGPNEVAKHLGLKLMLNLPLAARLGHPIGALNAYAKRADGIGQRASQTLEVFARVLAHNLMLVQWRELETLLVGLSQIPQYNPEQSNFPSILVDHVRACAGAETAAVFIREPDKAQSLHLWASSPPHPPEQTVYQPSDAIVSKVLEAGSAVRITDFSPELRRLMGWEGLPSKPRNLIAVPVGKRGILLCTNKLRPSILPFFSGFEEPSFKYLGRLVDAYVEDISLVQRLLRLDQDRDSYLQVLRHEINSPLHAILGDASWLRDHVSEGKDTASRIWKRIDDNVAVISSLARGSNAIDPNLKLNPEPVNLTEEVILPLQRFFNNEARRQGVQVKVDYLGLRPLVVDRIYTRMVFYNVIRNAIKYADPEERERLVRIYCLENSPGDVVTVVVNDNGIGVEAAERAKIFERYYRGQRAKAMAAGSGLGLAIAKNIMEKQGGCIKVLSLRKPTEIALEFSKERP